MTVQIDTTKAAEFDIVDQSVSSIALEEIASRLASDPFSGKVVFNKDQQNFRALLHDGLRYFYYLSFDEGQIVVTILSVMKADTGRKQRLQKLVFNIVKTVAALTGKSTD